jgi:beta-glucosidase/6-phospho-beta-glucosidase/beta-galactosidase
MSIAAPALLQRNTFLWASGIEDTFVPQVRPGDRALDEYELMGHYQHWRQDLALARELGLDALRWGVPWYRVEPRQGQFDWSWTDQVMPYMVEELGITPIIDLMHYGCPFWLQGEFASPGYPQAVAAYAAAFVRRYSSLAHWYTPLNEPIVNALMCGKYGAWPPYLQGDQGYLQIMMQLAKGIVHTAAAIKAHDPDAVLVHVEATGISRASQAQLKSLAQEEQQRGYLCYDLLTGRVGGDHPLMPWLRSNQIALDDLDWMRRQDVPIDIIGVNFYPQWSTQELFVDQRGELATRPVEQDGAGFGQLIEDFYRRYELPIMITETSAVGPEATRSAWLSSSLRAIKGLRASGVPVVGYTWFPLYTMIDWKYRTGCEPVDAYRLELGLYSLARDEHRWHPTSLVNEFLELKADSVGSAGLVAQGAGTLVEPA